VQSFRPLAGQRITALNQRNSPFIAPVGRAGSSSESIVSTQSAPSLVTLNYSPSWSVEGPASSLVRSRSMQGWMDRYPNRDRLVLCPPKSLVFQGLGLPNCVARDR